MVEAIAVRHPLYIVAGVIAGRGRAEDVGKSASGHFENGQHGPPLSDSLMEGFSKTVPDRSSSVSRVFDRVTA